MATDFAKIRAVVDRWEAAEKASLQANDPDARALAEAEQVQAAEEFMALAAPTLLRPSLARAAIAAPPGTRLTGAQEIEAERIFAQSFSASDLQNDPNRRTVARWILSRAVLTIKPALPAALADAFAASMYALNLGEDLSLLTKPTRHKGQRTDENLVTHVLAQLVGYVMGYRSVSQNKACAEVLPADMTVEAFKQRVSRNQKKRLARRYPEMDLSHILTRAKAEGAADRKAGKAFNPPVAGEYDLSRLAELDSKEWFAALTRPRGKQ